MTRTFQGYVTKIGDWVSPSIPITVDGDTWSLETAYQKGAPLLDVEAATLDFRVGSCEYRLTGVVRSRNSFQAESDGPGYVIIEGTATGLLRLQ